MLYTKIINNNKTFLFLYKKGKCIINKYVVIYVRKNNKPYNNFGITAGKKVGNAVMRNRAKRVIRQAYRENEIYFPVGLDIVIVARAAVCGIKSTVLSRWMKSTGIGKIRAEVFDKIK